MVIELKCEYCGRDEALPFVCNYCGGAFCADHRLPEAHQCKGDLTQKRTIVAPPQTTFSWQQHPETELYPTTKAVTVFSRIEIRDILAAWLALGVAFSFAFGYGALNEFAQGITYKDYSFFLGVSLVTVGPGFVFHELSHKFVARRYGFWAEFRMWPTGLLLGLFMSILSPFIFAAPGATYISGTSISQSENGQISAAGPLTNLILAAGIFLPMTLFAGGTLLVVGVVGLKVNSLLGVFNLLPFGPLDGAKVLRWSPVVWLMVLLPLGALFVFSLPIVI